MTVSSLGIHPINMVLAMLITVFMEFRKLPFGAPIETHLGVIQASVIASIITYSLINFVLPTMLFWVLDHLIATKEEKP